MTTHTKRCAHCGEPFKAERGDALTCGARCRVAHHRKLKAAHAPVTTAPVTHKQAYQRGFTIGRRESEREIGRLARRFNADTAVNRATKEALAQLQASYAAKVEEEVQRRLPNEAKAAIKAAEDDAYRAHELERVWHHRAEKLTAAVVLLMDNRRVLAGCLHPDRPERSKEALTKAAGIVNRVVASVEETDYKKWGRP